MAKFRNLQTRDGVYVVRVQAPKELLELRAALGIVGKKDRTVSLRTRDPREANRLFPAALARFHAEFETELAALRSAGALPPWSPTSHDIERTAFEFLSGELALDEEERVNRPVPAEVEAQMGRARSALSALQGRPQLEKLAHPDVLQAMSMAEAAQTSTERRTALLAELRDHLQRNEFALVDWAIAAAAHLHGGSLVAGTDAYKRVGRHLTLAWIKALETAARRDRGEYEELPPGPAPARSGVVATLPVKPPKGKSIANYFDSYLREARPDIISNSRKDALATLRQFRDCAGDKVVQGYTKEDMATFKRMLLASPAHAGRLYPGLTLPQTVERNKVDKRPLLAPKTVASKLSTLSAFGKWLEQNVDGITAANFATTAPAKGKAKPMAPFSEGEVVKILNALAFVGCESEKRQTEPGSYKIRDWRFWLTLIAAYTGARLNEITQLAVSDVRQHEGIWVFDISDEDDKSVKTANAKRRVPVHPLLLDLGLIEWRDREAAGGNTDLFHRVTPDADGRRSKRAGRWFSAFLERIGVKESSRGGAHRWRHTITDALRRAGVDDYDIGLLVGHGVDVARMTKHYGREVAMATSKRFALISKVEYPGVDLEVLR